MDPADRAFLMRRADELPVSESDVEQAVVQVRSEYLPIPDDDVAWLAHIAGSHQAHVPDITQLPRFSTFLDSHQVLCYMNGDEWYDVHPLIRAEIYKAQDAPDAGAR